MILPASVVVAKAADILPPPQTQPSEARRDMSRVQVISRNALVNHSDSMCATETIVYAVSGHGALLSHPSDEDGEPARHELGPGDFALIPAWTEHRAVNEARAADFHLVLVRSGGEPVEVKTGRGGEDH
ncbi:hypothetical protein BT67DRAFT_443634 [Trichocladium antarcticum]|uniref:Cupin 2 conserved barrel domain-containing protein n=1 Tax=Trichocladium antarcticum TaxID=1450529 RepID=A0AAN6ZCG6_9PEZI|nr:hypothetical protein BT67DRAFT_443634 [Trichocladium antarcticum]